MNDTYEWLYDNYAEPQLESLRKLEESTIKRLAESLSLSRAEVVAVSDTLICLRLRWGAEAFARGVQMGARLTAPRGWGQAF